MSPIEEDNKYDSLRAKIKGLPKVKAKTGFEARLMARIREEEKQSALPHELHSRTDKKEPAKNSIFGWLDGLFRPQFIPALGLTVVLLVAIVVYFGYFAGGNKSSDMHPTATTENVKNNDAGFVIYVHKDIESSNYPKNEIASLDAGDRTTSTGIIPNDTRDLPLNVRGERDYSSPKTEDPSVRPDRISDEQRIEMQRSVEIDATRKDSKLSDDKYKGVEKKSDDSKGFKNEKEAPSNYLRENKDTDAPTNGEVKQEIDGSEINKAESTMDKTGDLKKSEKRKGKDKDKVMSKTAKDSTKIKNEPVDTNSQEKNDSDKK